MDGSVADHSDSDSGESWTLLEHSPAYADEAPELPDNLGSHERATPEVHTERDEDTDGISIISDSDPESCPCEINLETYVDESRPTEQHTPHYISVTPLPTNNMEHESIRHDDDFLTDNNAKTKTYVHRRNKRLSTVLNIIMLGSVITAAGVAIGHMWGAKNDCSMHTTPSVNKILSNLYKLQEENAYLRSKLKELTLVNNAHLHRKTGNEKTTQKPQRCKKVYEEPLNNEITDRITKCVDEEDINKTSTEKKISYADSLKTEQPQQQVQKLQSPEEKQFDSKLRLSNQIKKKGEKIDDLESSWSDFKFIKDDRYIGPKNKQERKKYDRQKLHKKQKRKNKYEQWEMKGGYMKDYDEISLASSQDNNEQVNKNLGPNIEQDYEPNIIINQLPKIDKSTILEGNEHKVKRDKYFKNDITRKNNKNKEYNWYDKRAVLRSEARKRLEEELFGENTPNNAGWYFRRMQKREQCRAKGDNSTYRKLAKRQMNYKIKH